MSAFRDSAKQLLGPKWTTRLRCLVRGRPLPLWGNMRRTTPFSEYFGFERGTPVDRFYLHRFLEQNRGVITGRVLEIQVTGYTRRYGTHLVQCDSVDINPAMEPTYLCDLAASEPLITSDAYDCFLLPNTLNVLRDIEGCLRHALRVIRPGGTILAAAACLVPLDPHAPDYWHLSADGWREVAGRAWAGHDFEVEGHGNCLAATAAMMGLALEELDPEELERPDPRYPVLVTLRCRKRK